MAHIRVVQPPIDSIYCSPRTGAITLFLNFPTKADSAHVWLIAPRPHLPHHATMAYTHQLGTVGVLCKYPCHANRLPLPCPTQSLQLTKPVSSGLFPGHEECFSPSTYKVVLANIPDIENEAVGTALFKDGIVFSWIQRRKNPAAHSAAMQELRLSCVVKVFILESRDLSDPKFNINLSINR